MASLKKEFGNDVDFYFIEYNQPEAKPIIEEFQIVQHPETFFINEKLELVDKMEGFSKEMEPMLREMIENLNET